MASRKEQVLWPNVQGLDEQNEYLKNIMVDENAIANKIRQKERLIKVKSEYLDGIKDLIK